MKKKNILILYLNFLPHLAFWVIAALTAGSATPPTRAWA